MTGFSSPARSVLRRLSTLILAVSCILPAGAASSVGNPKTLPVGPRELMPLEPRSKTFRVIEGDHRGEKLPLELSSTDNDSPQRWKLRLGEDQVLYLRADEKGGLHLSRIIVQDKQKSIVYRDPLPLLPEKLETRPSRVTRTKADIYDLKSGRLERTGPVRHRITAISRTRFDVRAGSYDGYLVEFRQRIDFTDAEVNAEVEVGFAPEVGIIKGRGRFVTEKRFWFDSVILIGVEWESP